ncbi:MAG: alanine racemase [Ruminococcaceae bacterium]|nr:alanine racemase [Oscillospiraceae bacterium]
MQLKSEIICDRTYAEIEMDAILHNFDALSSLLPSEVKKMAVVKANAYGHGAVPVARALEERADYFAVACIDEAAELRGAGIKKPILILGYTSPARYGELVEQDLTATLYDTDGAAALSQVALSRSKRARVHIAVDTGMGRIGFSPDPAGADQAARLASMKGLLLEGVFSHYACADEESLDSALEQEAKFDRFLALLEDRGLRPPLRHICNSAATLRMKRKYDLCRFGISLYGYSPDPKMPLPLRLERAMTVKSKVIHVKTVEQGTPIGYGHTYVAPTRRRIATVSIGYADGYNRCISGKGYVLIGGVPAPVVGRICMDQMMVDVTSIPETKVGDEVTVMGKSGETEISAELLGEWANSFSYEVLCTFLPRVKICFVKTAATSLHREESLDHLQ